MSDPKTFNWTAGADRGALIERVLQLQEEATARRVSDMQEFRKLKTERDSACEQRTAFARELLRVRSEYVNGREATERLAEELDRESRLVEEWATLAAGYRRQAEDARCQRDRRLAEAEHQRQVADEAIRRLRDCEDELAGTVEANRDLQAALARKEWA